MMRVMGVAAVAAVIGLVQPAFATEDTFANVGNWTISYHEHDCMMSTMYKDNSILMLKYDANKQSTWIMFTDPAIKSLKAGDVKTLEVVFTSGTTATYDDGWGKNDFSVLILDSGEQVLFKRFSATEMLNDFAKYKTLAFFYNDKVIESLPLSGSADAIKSLRTCAVERRRANPSDPFE